MDKPTRMCEICTSPTLIFLAEDVRREREIYMCHYCDALAISHKWGFVQYYKPTSKRIR